MTKRTLRDGLGGQSIMPHLERWGRRITVSFGLAWAIEQDLVSKILVGGNCFLNGGKPRACFLLGCMCSLKLHRDKPKQQGQMLCRRLLAITAVSHSWGIKCLYSIQKQPIPSEKKGEMLAHPLPACHKCNPKTWPGKIDGVTFLPYVRHPGPVANCCLLHTDPYSLNSCVCT